jgi:DNA-binding transcriptional MerR regulator
VATGIREFSSAQELLRFIDLQLTDLRKTLGELLRIIEELRAKSELDKKIRELVMKLGAKREAVQSERQDIIKLEEGMELIINPPPSVELRYLEDLAESINKKIAKLQTARKGVEKLAEIGLEAKLEVILVDDVPTSIIIRF